MLKKFNVRVYGLVVQNGQVLVSKEQYGKHHLTKFPGGGLELGEGVLECLQREFKEELQVTINSHRLFYITENFIQSAFKENEQVIGLYYLVEVSHSTFNHTEHQVNWEIIDQAHKESIGFTFEQDKLVYSLLVKKLNL